MTELAEHSQDQAIKHFLRKYLGKSQCDLDVHSLLGDAGAYYGADRVCVFDFKADKEGFEDVIVWSAPGVEGEGKALRSLSLAQFENWEDTFREQGELYIPSVRAAAAYMSSDLFDSLAELGVESVLVAPIYAEDEVLGFLGIHNPRSNVDDLLLLSVIASSCYNSIAARREALCSTRDSSAQLAQREAVISSLSGIFNALYLVNLEENSIQELVRLTSTNALGTDLGSARDFFRKLVNTLVAPESRPEMRVFTNLETLDARLGDKRSITSEYFSQVSGWVRSGICPVERAEDGHLVTALFTLRRINAEHRDLDRQNVIIKGLSLPYENLYSLDPETGIAHCYRMNQHTVDNYGEQFILGDYAQNIAIYVQKEVLEEDRPLFNLIKDADAVALLLHDCESYSFDYRVVRNSAVKYFRLTVVKPGSSNDEYLFGFMDVDDQHRRDSQKQQLIEGLGSEYYSVLMVQPNRDHVVAFRAEGEDGRNIEKSFQASGGCWSQGIRRYAEDFVVESSQQELVEKLDLDYMRLAKEPYEVIYEKRVGDETMFLQARVTFVPGEDGECVSVVGTRNVDALVRRVRQQEQALRTAYAEAEAANKAKTEFLSNMSHDIRTPMNGIIGMTAIAAAHSDDPERVHDCLGKITQASKHLLGLINEVLDMSKIESGKVTLNEEPFGLSDLMENLISMTASQIEERGHHLSVNISGVQHEGVVGDSLRIQKIFTNILGNAVKFTPDGGQLSIIISEQPSPKPGMGLFRFVFQDNGIGMAPEFMDHIFEPFSREEQGGARSIQGTGLGMPISRSIARMMGGDITVASELGQGSTFTVTIYLGLQQDQLAPGELDERLIDLGVLVADDDEAALESCCFLLEDLGMKPVGVTSGQAALDSVVLHHEHSDDFFACVLDWKMPGMDGIETTRAIRAAVGEDVPIIIISAYDWSDIEQEARRAGANAFISKPLFRSRLEKTFNGLVRGEVEELSETPLQQLAELDLAGKRALLVEDNELNAEIAAEVLHTAGLEVEFAIDGAEAVDKVATCADGYYDIVFMDIQMPVMNGYDATRAIRAMDRVYCRELPIVAMTANAFAEDVQAAKTAGLNGHIAKPLDIAVLVRTLHRWLA